MDALGGTPNQSSPPAKRTGDEPRHLPHAPTFTEEDVKRIVEQVTAAVTQTIIKNVAEPLEARFDGIEKLIKLENDMEHLAEAFSDFRKLRKEKKGR